MKKMSCIIALILAFCLVAPYSSFAADKSTDVTVNNSGKLERNGSAISGLYNDVYYSDGARESNLNAIMKIGGDEYYLRQGKPYTGIYGNRFYSGGVWCSSLNGSYSIDGEKYEFVKGEIEKDESTDKAVDFTNKFNFYSGPIGGFYYENGKIASDFTGFKVFRKHTYYVVDGKLFNGYFDGCYYKNGIADSGFSGLHGVNGKNYCFMAGYFFTGIFESVYYVGGLRSDVSGYKTIDNIRYFLSDGALANGVFDGAFFKNGLVDTSVNGKLLVDGEYYDFIKGITSDGLHDGRWYTNGIFDKTAQGIKLYGGLPHYLKDGVLSSGVAEYKGKLRYFENGELTSFTGWKNIGEDRYFIEKGVAKRGVAEIDSVKYLFDAEGKLCKEREALFENVVYTSDENGVASLAPQIFIPQRGNPLPYPHKTRPNATISSSGCGVCSALMIIRNSTTYDVTLEEMTQKMLDYGCRIESGSDMKRASELLWQDYGISCEITDDNAKLREHLKKGYLAVANVGKIPLFSFTGGHFIVISGIIDDDNVIIFDPNTREGKYGTGIRKDIHYNSENNEVYTTFDVLRSDSWYGCYYLFTPTKDIALRRSQNTVINDIDVINTDKQ